MSVSSTEAVTGGLLAAAATSSTDDSSATEDQDMFLQLLVAQLKYQDPMNPTDSTEFLSQNAQFTSLEKMQDLADDMTQLLTAQVAFGASGMIGRQVSWVDSSGTTRTGVASGVSYLATGPVLDVAGTQVPVTSVTGVAATSDTADSTTTA